MIICIAVAVVVCVLVIWNINLERNTIYVDEFADPNDLPSASEIIPDISGDIDETGDLFRPNLPGMPEDYVLSEEQVEQKKALRTEVLPSFDSMRPGSDYTEGEFIFLAADETEAELIAAAYDGELLDFELGVASARLGEDSPYTLGDLLAVAADPNNNFPPIEPNLMYHTAGM